MNILFVINSLELGGAETFLLRLIRELRDHHEVKPFLYELRSEKNKNEFRNYFLGFESSLIFIEEDNIKLSTPKYRFKLKLDHSLILSVKFKSKFEPICVK